MHICKQKWTGLYNYVDKIKWKNVIDILRGLGGHFKTNFVYPCIKILEIAEVLKL